jgi:rare lipoprotein A
MQIEPNGAGGATPRGNTRARRWIAAAALSAGIVCGASSGWAEPPNTAKPKGGLLKSKVVHASWYGHEFASRPTASGERFDPNKLTGAHRTLPLGTKLRVTNLQNGRSVMVVINDRGPYVRPRELDLSLGAARVLGMLRSGVVKVRIEPVES